MRSLSNTLSMSFESLFRLGDSGPACVVSTRSLAAVADAYIVVLLTGRGVVVFFIL